MRWPVFKRMIWWVDGFGGEKGHSTLGTYILQITRKEFNQTGSIRLPTSGNLTDLLGFHRELGVFPEDLIGSLAKALGHSLEQAGDGGLRLHCFIAVSPCKLIL